MLPALLRARCGMVSSMASYKAQAAIEMAPAQSEKVRENRLRARAERQKLVLRKSRTRDPRARDYGRYELVDDDGAVVVDTKALDEIEDYLDLTDVTIEACLVPSYRQDFLYQLDVVFREAARLNNEHGSGDLQTLSTELAALLAPLDELRDHLNRLGWSDSDESKQVTLKYNDALKQARRGRR